jgi:hypothetical protein
MRTVTLLQLRTRSQQRADLENATLFIPPSEWNDMVNESYAEYYDIVRAAFGSNYYRKSANITTSATVASYDLPADFLTLISVDVTLGQNIFLTARPFMEPERNIYKFFPMGWFFGQPIYYQLQGVVAGKEQVLFIPTPQGGFTVTVNYVPTPTLLVGDTDTLNGVNGWDEFVTLRTAIKALVKDGDTETIMTLKSDLAECRARIEALAPQRDNQGERVVDVTSYRDEWF